MSQPSTSPSELARTLQLTASERLSFIGYDLEQTHRFYTDVLRLPLVYAETRDYLPGREEYAPHIEVRYALRDGSTLSFFVFRGEPPEPLRRLHPLRHFALAVRDVPTLQAWKAHLEAKGVEVVGEIDHDVLMSIYFYDPNAIRLELTTALVEFDEHEAERAQRIYEEWWTLGVSEQHTPVGGHRRGETAG